MNFMQPDEFLLLMDFNQYHSDLSGKFPYHILTTGEKSRLYDVGIRTAHEQPSWGTIEPSKGQYNFDYLDGIIKDNRDVGMKSLIQISGWMPPTWMPNEWFARTVEGSIERTCLSIWNEEAQQYSDDYYIMLRDRYLDQKDVAFFFGEYQGGEGVYVASWCLYDDPAIQDYKKVYGTDAMPVPDKQETLDWFGAKAIEHFIRKATILYEPWHEIWNAQQYLMNVWTKAFGNFMQPEVMKKYRELFPDADIVLLQYTYFDGSHDANNANYVDMLRDISGCEVIAEAMFCSGLAHTTPKSIAKGFRGQIICPGHSGFEASGLDDYKVNAIRESNNLWRASKGL